MTNSSDVDGVRFPRGGWVVGNECIRIAAGSYAPMMNSNGMRSTADVLAFAHSLSGEPRGGLSSGREPTARSYPLC